jgi:hypothetical protein
MRWFSIAFSAAVLVGAAEPAHAQPEGRASVVERLADASRGATAQGFRGDARVFDGRGVIGLLPAGGVVVLEASLRAGTRYTVVGVCDGDCQDLDLRAQAPASEEVLDEDVNTDDVPVLHFTAHATGPHRITVVMSGCRSDLCYFGVRVLAR